MKRDILRRTVLELLAQEPKHYTELEKKLCGTCYEFATPNTFRRQLKYLIDYCFIERISRGIYKITTKGEKYLDLLQF